jgi:predicted DNA-binding transcriptional regulator YafY
MTQTARVYKIELLIRNRGQVSFQDLLAELEVSPATLKRDLAYLRDRLGAPIEYDRYSNGYRLAEGWRGEKHELPGLWFSERELYALLMAHQLLGELDDDGVISRHLQPLRERVQQMLAGGEAQAQTLLRRVRIISPAKRPVPSQFFERVGEALSQRRRLHMRYLTRGRGTVSEREVSPQRLVHHRNTWYLDAWCHSRQRLLRFALDAIQEATALDTPARELPLEQVEAAMDAGYGIYAGADRQWARILVTPTAAQWISREQWHPDQRGRWLDDGRYELEVPFSDETEIAMDILRQGDRVEVLGPDSLVAEVQRRLEAAARQYRRRAGARQSGGSPVAGEPEGR